MRRMRSVRLSCPALLSALLGGHDGRGSAVSVGSPLHLDRGARGPSFVSHAVRPRLRGPARGGAGPRSDRWGPPRAETWDAAWLPARANRRGRRRLSDPVLSVRTGAGAMTDLSRPVYVTGVGMVRFTR